ncbi:ABC transporter ATP-binding protein [Acidicapsa ligni]|uniref:ABC transporter ATP-binding protein n=1 Tax=Acidicapsa ligni TaxID=542300 RepID=UPI0021E0C868|nr:ABC transporter ATP-binding protein [Acidicapsa ligni]
MATMRGGGIDMKAERGGHGRGKGGSDLPKRKVDIKKLWPTIWTLVKPRRWLLLAGFVLVAIKTVAGLTMPALSKYLLDDVLATAHPKPNLLPMLIAIVFAATIIQAITSYSLTQLLSKEGQKLISELRKRVQQHVGRLSVAYYDANRTGTLVSRIMNDVEGVRNLIGTGLVEFVGGMLTAVLAFAYLLHRSVTVTVTVFLVIGVFVVILQYGFKRVRPIFRERAKINAEVTGRLTESLGGVRVIKGYHAEEREASVFGQGVERLLKNVVSSLTMTSTLSSASTAVLGLVSAIVMWLGGHAVLNHGWTIGDYFSYNMFLAFMIAPVFQIVNIGTQLTEAFAGLDRTTEILAELEENSDPNRTRTMPPIHGTVKFEHVEFEYETGKPVLHDVNFLAQPGSVTALVGSSGSGKSTIISLICAFHNPVSGSVVVDGLDLATVDLNSYRSQLGVVLQDSFLFDGSIRDNVMFSRPGSTEEQFLSACRTARVDEFAERFPETYDTIVGERGVKLSGGQRQRLSIARALLAEPRILILDEATSSLDSESEAMIQAGLNQLMLGRTTFVIAHRLSTIRRADQILVVEGGRILERGNHEELYTLHGRYYDLYTRQHGLEENLFLAPGEGDAVPEVAR